MTACNTIPSKSYGIRSQSQSQSALDVAAEEVKNLGFSIIDSGYTTQEIQDFLRQFDKTRVNYLNTYGEKKLKNLDELYTIRAPLIHGGEAFLKLALNANLILILNKLIDGKFILNQQNGIINPPEETYNQGAWHRDLPYQHFVSTKPLAINALFCVDDFTVDNGATFVLPGSHKTEEFPSPSYVKKNALQIEAKAGCFILLDCMVFHAGGFNNTKFARRGVNHVYTVPFFKQQINIPMNINGAILSAEERDILGFNYLEPSCISDYLATRLNKVYG